MKLFFPVVSGWCLLSVCFFRANALEQDFFPLAAGNWWEFDTKTGQIERWEITGGDSNAFTLTRTNKTPGYSRNYSLKPTDDSGRINTPCGRDQGCIWAPQAMLPGTAAMVTPWGTVEKSRLFCVTWGHPSGGDWSCICAPGIGPVAWCYEGMLLKDTVTRLAGYHLETVPATRSHSIATGTDVDTGVQVTWAGGSIAEVVAHVAGPSYAKWYSVSSYNPLTRSIRIYLADTASHTPDGSSAMESYDHLFTLEHLDPDSLYRFKLYRVAYDPGVEYDAIQSSQLYDRPLIAGKVSTGKPAHHSVAESGFTVSGRIVTIRNGIPGKRMPLSCTLFSVDGRCIARQHTGEHQESVKVVAPGTGVYILRFRNGNATWLTTRIVIAR